MSGKRGASGGKRVGAGRKDGSTDAGTKEQRAAIGELPRAYTKQALETLVQVATKGESETARVAAAMALLDLAMGGRLRRLRARTESRSKSLQRSGGKTRSPL